MSSWFPAPLVYGYYSVERLLTEKRYTLRPLDLIGFVLCLFSGPPPKLVLVISLGPYTREPYYRSLRGLNN